MARSNEHEPSRLTVLIAVTLVVAVLYFTKEVLLPLALGTLLSFMVAPLVTWLEMRKLGRIPSVLVAVGLAMGVLGGLGYFMTTQLVDLAGQLPAYEENLRNKARDVREYVGGGSGDLTKTIKGVQEELTKQAEEKAPGANKGPTEANPMPVRVVDANTDPLPVRMLTDWLTPLLGPLGTAAVVLVFVIFMLLQREDLRDRLIRLAGTERVFETTQALDEAAARVSKYLLMQLIINATYGLAAGVGLWLIGLPNPLLWGLLAMVFRFIPYVGPWIAAVLPIGLSIAVFEDWTGLFWTVGLIVVLELWSNNIMEPWLYGSSTGLSAFGVIVSAAFWTWLWGPIGLVLSMPLTVCAIVVGRHVPQLKFLNILLSDQPALASGVRFYQRLLAFDDYEANNLVAGALQDGTPDDVYEGMILPALSMAERDRQAGLLSDNQLRFIQRFVRDQVRSQVRPAEAGNTPPVPGDTALRILCVPAEDAADRLAGQIVAQRLAARGHIAEAIPNRAGGREAPEQIRQREPDVVIVSALAPGGAIPARRAVEKLRAKFPRVRLVVGVWNAQGDLTRTKQRLEAVGAEFFTASLREALDHLQEGTALTTPPGTGPDGAPDGVRAGHAPAKAR